MKILWNPWRYEYIRRFTEEKEGKVGEKECLFCKLQKMSEDDALMVYRGKFSFVVLNAYPYNSGHLMIAPYAHVSDPTQLEEEASLEIVHVLKRSLRVLRRVFAPDGFNIGANIGRAAGAGVPDHFHIHVVPRWVGDANFIAIIGETKPIPVSLREVYEAIKKSWNEDS